MRFTHNWLMNEMLEAKVKKHSGFVKGGRLLDVGCGTKPYEKYFDCSEYVGLDTRSSVKRSRKNLRKRKNKIDVYGDAIDMPFKNCEFDCAVSFQVLEHIDEPQKMIDEMARVLKKGGRIIITAPQQWMLHEEPYDFFRYTKYGLMHLCENAGFRVIMIEPFGGFWMMMSLKMSYHIFSYHKLKVLTPFLLLLCVIVQSFGWVLDRIDVLHRKEQETCNYVIMAEKI